MKVKYINLSKLKEWQTEKKVMIAQMKMDLFQMDVQSSFDKEPYHLRINDLGIKL